MPLPMNRISMLILEQLGSGEKRVLSLTVAVRKALDRSEAVKGDLSVAVKSALNKLVSSELVVDVDGLYGLAPHRASRSHVCAGGSAGTSSRR